MFHDRTCFIFSPGERTYGRTGGRALAQKNASYPTTGSSGPPAPPGFGRSDAARGFGIRAVHLEVARRNVPAREFSRRMGFEDHDRYLMTKCLGQ